MSKEEKEKILAEVVAEVPQQGSEKKEDEKTQVMRNKKDRHDLHSRMTSRVLDENILLNWLEYSGCFFCPLNEGNHFEGINEDY